MNCCWKLRARLLCLFCWLLVADVRGVCGGTCTRHLGAVLHCQCRTAPRYHMVGSGWHSEFWIVFQHVNSVSLTLQVGHSLSAGSSWRQRSGACWRFHQCVCQQVPRVSRMSWGHQDKKKVLFHLEQEWVLYNHISSISLASVVMLPEGCGQRRISHSGSFCSGWVSTNRCMILMVWDYYEVPQNIAK